VPKLVLFFFVVLPHPVLTSFFFFCWPGSGKTAAFLIPTLSALFGRAKELQKPRPAPYETRRYQAEPLILIICPTRELCSQIFDECRKVNKQYLYVMYVIYHQP
jgi:superfamily II DNA/RNA helicase